MTCTLQSCSTAGTREGRRSQSLNTHTLTHFTVLTYYAKRFVNVCLCACYVLTASRLLLCGSFMTLHLSSSNTSSSSPACVKVSRFLFNKEQKDTFPGFLGVSMLTLTCFFRMNSRFPLRRQNRSVRPVKAQNSSQISEH